MSGGLKFYYFWSLKSAHEAHKNTKFYPMVIDN